MNVNISFLNNIYSIAIDRVHYIRRLGYPKDYEVPDSIEESMQWAAQWYQKNGNPWLQIFEVDVAYKNEQLMLNNFETNAPKIYKRFQKHQVQKALLIASTSGNNVDTETSSLWASDYPDKAFFLDTYAASVAEALVSFAVTYIQNWTAQKAMKSLSRYSPGYPGWDLKEQFLLMKIVQKATHGIVPISISDTALLSPLKSQFSLVGIYQGEASEKQIDIACTQCNFIDCSCKDQGMFIKNNH